MLLMVQIEEGETTTANIAPLQGIHNLSPFSYLSCLFLCLSLFEFALLLSFTLSPHLFCLSFHVMFSLPQRASMSLSLFPSLSSLFLLTPSLAVSPPFLISLFSSLSLYLRLGLSLWLQHWVFCVRGS